MCRYPGVEEEEEEEQGLFKAEGGGKFIQGLTVNEEEDPERDRATKV